MARVINFGGSTPRQPLSVAQVQSLQLQQLLRKPRQVQSIGEGFTGLGTDLIRNLVLKRLKADAQGKLDARDRTIKESLSPVEVPGKPRQGPTGEGIRPEVPLKLDPNDLDPQEFGGIGERTRLSDVLHQENKEAAQQFANDKIRRFALPPSLSTTRQPTPQERIAILSQNPDTLPLALQFSQQNQLRQQDLQDKDRQNEFALSKRLWKIGNLK